MRMSTSVSGSGVLKVTQTVTVRTRAPENDRVDLRVG